MKLSEESLRNYVELCAQADWEGGWARLVQRGYEESGIADLDHALACLDVALEEVHKVVGAILEANEETADRLYKELHG